MVVLRAVSTCVESGGLCLWFGLGLVDADDSGGCGGAGPLPESLGVGVVVGVLDGVAALPCLAPAAVVDLVGGEQ